MTLPSQARVVIIGGGVVGCSVAYHLTKLGWTDVVLLERKQLTSGTTWHAAGLIAQLRATANMTKLAKYSQELYGSLEAETGVATGFKRVGSITVALTEERKEELWRSAAMARAFGVEIEEITPDEARKLPSIFRKACQDLGFCEERVYGKQLTQTINHRVMSLYRHLYRDPKPFRPVHFYLRTFPGAFKSNLTLFWISAALFWVPFFATLALGEKGMVWYQAILGADNMHAMEQMYGHQGNE